MNKNKYYLAIDIGASSGRHIVGWKEDGQLKLEEVYRFSNGTDTENGHAIWDISRLMQEVICGIKVALSKYEIQSLSVDTWGVDYVLLSGEQEILPCYAYRDHRTISAIENVQKLIDFPTLYGITGIQFQQFNTIYQLYDDLTNGRLANATDFLMIPEYIMYKLTGVKSKEYTNATTGALVDVKTGEYSTEIISALNLPTKLFSKLNKSGFVLGNLLPSISKQVGGNCKVMLCATHDTGAAYEAVDSDENDIVISSGTWSLIGIKTKNAIVTEKSLKQNFSNEGGVGYFRFLKNIMGMWLINRVSSEYNISAAEMVIEAQKSTYTKTFDVNHNDFLAPKNMAETVIKHLGERVSNPDLYASMYHSLALSYKNAIDNIQDITGKTFNNVYIVGGGAKNTLLNNLTAQYTGKNVIALPIEATATGNIISQIKGDK